MESVRERLAALTLEWVEYVQQSGRRPPIDAGATLNEVRVTVRAIISRTTKPSPIQIQLPHRTEDKALLVMATRTLSLARKVTLAKQEPMDCLEEFSRALDLAYVIHELGGEL